MLYDLLADLVLILHLVFILFTVLGGFLVLIRRHWAWVHLPAVVWSSLVELTGWICPLTPLEVNLRRSAGSRGYEGGFIEHYLLPVIYPADLTRELQIAIGISVLLVNGLIYTWVLAQLRRKSAPPRAHD